MSYERITGASSLKRIHIVGGPGSGKTTLARQIAGRLKVPFYDLDEVGYENGSGPQRPLEVRLAELKQIAAQPAWVTEGIYLSWTSELIEKADLIIWLDLPWRIARWRIVSRHLKAELRRNNRHPGWRNLYKFLQWCSQYYDKSAELHEVTLSDIQENRVSTAYMLSKYSAKIVHCQRPGQVKKFLNNLATPN